MISKYVPHILIATLCLFISLRAQAIASEDTLTTSIDQKALDSCISKAIAYLKQQGQDEDGSYTKQAGIGPTALVIVALLRHGTPISDPSVEKGLKYLEGFVQPSGGIHQPNSLYRNYETCLAILCFSEANDSGQYDTIIKKADAYIKGLQWNGKGPTDIAYGGGGYGRHKRPDLSNTSFLIDALKAAGNDANSESIQRALVFVSRCQNLKSKYNNTAFADKNPDGGFYYTPAAGGSSPAGETPNGGLRSYGAMTYAGLKSLLYANVSQDDLRVKAAIDWIQLHYNIEENPGLGTMGLYYYYHLFAKALNALGEENLTDSDGIKHNWRAELVAELVSRQKEDGTWSNENERWLENDPNLVTGYVLLALSYCR